MKYAKEYIEGLNELCKEDDLPSDMSDDWAKGFYDYLCSQLYYDGTGIVFVGYGTDESAGTTNLPYARLLNAT